MQKFSMRLKELRVRHQLSQQKLSDIIGVSKSSINMYERGEREPGLDTIAAFADYFKVDMNYLLGESDSFSQKEWSHSLLPTERKRIPILGEIACGQPIFAEEGQACFVEMGGAIHADFCLRAKGDSMIGARIMDGDLVFIHQQPSVENGEIAAVIIDDTATLKRVYYYPQEQKLALNAENPQYPPLIYVGEELDHIKILGKAIAFQSEL
ncbi:MAG: helix-turn-helix domain-containing protein [Clostridia bacterium]|nr:helix-turn-helix domain-containing protein [Clostridia bacterium]